MKASSAILSVVQHIVSSGYICYLKGVGYRRLLLNKVVRSGIHVDLIGLFNNLKYTFEDKEKS